MSAVGETPSTRVFAKQFFARCKHTQETDGVIDMRKTMIAILVLLTPLFVSATTTVPVVNGVTITRQPLQAAFFPVVSMGVSPFLL
jgi:hypothetical protein